MASKVRAKLSILVLCFLTSRETSSLVRADHLSQHSATETTSAENVTSIIHGFVESDGHTERQDIVTSTIHGFVKSGGHSVNTTERQDIVLKTETLETRNTTSLHPENVLRPFQHRRDEIRPVKKIQSGNILFGGETEWNNTDTEKVANRSSRCIDSRCDMEYPGHSLMAEITSTNNSSNLMDSATAPPADVSGEVVPDEKYTFTCRGRCGLDITLPCSCTASCVVYRTCCKHMTRDCPHVVLEGRTRFEILSKADVTCDKSVFKISSCPTQGSLQDSQEESSHRTFSDSQRNSDIQRFSSESFDVSMNILRGTSSTSTSPTKVRLGDITGDALNYILLSAPVTDASSGFTFINRDIYECHKTPSVEPLLWSLVLEYKDQNPRSLIDFAPFPNGSPQYGFAYRHQLLNLHYCQKDLIRTCNYSRPFTEKVEEYSDKCQTSGAAIVYSQWTQKHYANIFCAYCNEGQHDAFNLERYNYYSIPRKPNDKLQSVLLSLSSAGNYSVTIRNPAGFITPWDSAECSVSPNKRLSTSVCVPVCSYFYFQLKSDRICKARRSVQVALTADEVPSLCPAVRTHMGQFIECGLKLLVPSMKFADFLSTTVSFQFDTRTSKYFYVSRIQMDLLSTSNSIFSDESQEAMKNIHLLAILKGFKDFSLARSLCTGKYHKTENTEEKGRTSIKTVPFRMSTDNQEKEFDEAGRQVRGVLVDSPNKTTVCFSFTRPAWIDHIERVTCYEDSHRERDHELRKVVITVCKLLASKSKFSERNDTLCTYRIPGSRLHQTFGLSGRSNRILASTPKSNAWFIRHGAAVV
ncbi:hypothetical protein ElyMa_000407800 [Elysia marginata]|uniref:SMB domain-containing protein n=1 Tax=Elysia marginata TaxID=1093978 RepID=A0AAV4FL14_9GAST|nr:hypothetical protein ElyMa_000407800 [Elysia marginata]